MASIMPAGLWTSAAARTPRSPRVRCVVEIKQWHVPGRVNLIGEHLDHNGGPTLPFAIDRGLTVKARRRDDDRVAVWSGGERADLRLTVAPGEVEGWAAYVAGAVWALQQSGHRVVGTDLVVESRLPRGAGLASSAALTCGVTLALADTAGDPLDPHTVAAVAQPSNAAEWPGMDLVQAWMEMSTPSEGGGQERGEAVTALLLAFLKDLPVADGGQT